ncbi:MAG TPA: biotin/lipoyl-binding carrier protein [Jatrophihabitantaceae bacterium]|jgi:acetyl-CoA carboxylase biotin carboxyl carrier protein|nr:biotin/lipoyl-binding carrier protein [Jatrophihabitantaceae bacterium]
MSHTVVAELVSNVYQVVAEVGQRVGPSDTLVILESMKMEIPVLAEVTGVVREVAVRVGDVISEGDVIAVIDNAAAGAG